MTVGKIKEIALYQTANDIEDIDDFETVLQPYFDEGYDMAVHAYAGVHPGMDDEFPVLTRDDEVPAVPEWLHVKLADWMSWRILADGAPARQQRGMVFRQSFELALNQIRSGEGKGNQPSGPWKFVNIPRR